MMCVAMPGEKDSDGQVQRGVRCPWWYLAAPGLYRFNERITLRAKKLGLFQ